MALCDPELVYQVALNLLVNAVQMLSDGGAVEIGAAAAARRLRRIRGHATTGPA